MNTFIYRVPKGTVSQDFLALGFFINQLHGGQICGINRQILPPVRAGVVDSGGGWKNQSFNFFYVDFPGKAKVSLAFEN